MQRVQKLYLSKPTGSDILNKSKPDTLPTFLLWNNKNGKGLRSVPAWQRYKINANISTVTCTQSHCLRWSGRVWLIKLLLSPLLARVWCLHQIWRRPSTTENTFQHVSDWSCLLWWRSCVSCPHSMNSDKIQLHSSAFSALQKVPSELFFHTKLTYIRVLHKLN